MKFYSEQLNKLFDSAEELKAAEDKVNAAKKAEEEKKAQREERAKEVEEAFKLANEDTKKAYALLREFLKDYGSFHTTLREPLTFIDDIFFNLF